MSEAAVATPPVETPVVPQETPVQSPVEQAEAARTAELTKLDAAETIEEYKALRHPPKDEEQVESPSRARDEKGRFVEGKPRDDAKARKESIQAEINRLTWERGEAERSIAAAKAEAERIKAEAVAPKTAEPAKATTDFPDFEEWSKTNPGKTYETYLDDRSDWRTERRMRAADESRKATESQRAIATVQTAHDARLATAKQRYTDWDERELAFAPLHKAIPPPPALVAAVLPSEKSAEYTYYLMTHPQEYAQLARDASALPVAAADMVRRILDVQMSGGAAPATSPAPPVQQSKANPPPKLVGGGAPSVSSLDPEEMSVDQYREHFRNRQRAKHER